MRALECKLEKYFDLLSLLFGLSLCKEFVQLSHILAARERVFFCSYIFKGKCTFCLIVQTTLSNSRRVQFNGMPSPCLINVSESTSYVGFLQTQPPTACGHHAPTARAEQHETEGI